MLEFIKRIKNLFVNNWQAVLTAAVFAFLVALPTILPIIKISDSFKGIYPITIDDQEFYLTKVREVYDGNINSGNPFLKEHKNNAYLTPALGEYIFANSAKLLRVSVPFIFLINDFILIFLGVLLVYYLIYSITNKKNISLLFTTYFYLLMLRDFSRPVNPQFSILFLFLGLIFIWKVYSIKDLNKIAFFSILLGLTLGLSVYTQPYFWTTLSVIYFFIILSWLKKKEFFYLRYSFLPFVSVFSLVCLPYLKNIMRLVKNPFYHETTLRMGMLYNNHYPAAFLSAGLLILTIVWLVFNYKKNNNEKIFYFSIIALAGMLFLNWQNIITGNYLWFSSHYFPPTILSVILVFAINYQSINLSPINDKKTLLIKGVLFIIFLTVNGALINRQLPRSLSMYKFSDEKILEKMQDYKLVFDWFNDNTENNSAVYCLGDNYCNLLTAYTHNNLYSNSYAGLNLMSDEEVEDRWVRQNIFTEENIDKEIITKNNTGIWHLKFLAKYQNEEVRRKIFKLFTGGEEAKAALVPDDYIERMISKFEEARKSDLNKELKKFEIDYVLLDLNDANYADLPDKFENFSFFKPIKRFDDVLIYQIN